MSEDRNFVVPASRRPEPAGTRIVRLETPLGPAVLVISFPDSQPLPPSLYLQRGEACFNRVDYRWSVQCEPDERAACGYAIKSSELRRDSSASHSRNYWDPPTSSAHTAFEAHFPALAELVAAWYADNPSHVHERWLEYLNWSAHYLENDLNRTADQLAEKLGELADLERQITLAEGSVSLLATPRTRYSPLAG
jgi:hypothetical protein